MQLVQALLVPRRRSSASLVYLLPRAVCLRQKVEVRKLVLYHPSRVHPLQQVPNCLREPFHLLLLERKARTSQLRA